MRPMWGDEFYPNENKKDKGIIVAYTDSGAEFVCGVYSYEIAEKVFDDMIKTFNNIDDNTFTMPKTDLKEI